MTQESKTGCFPTHTGWATASLGHTSLLGADGLDEEL